MNNGKNQNRKEEEEETPVDTLATNLGLRKDDCRKGPRVFFLLTHGTSTPGIKTLRYLPPLVAEFLLPGTSSTEAGKKKVAALRIVEQLRTTLEGYKANAVVCREFISAGHLVAALKTHGGSTEWVTSTIASYTEKIGKFDKDISEHEVRLNAFVEKLATKVRRRGE